MAGASHLVLVGLPGAGKTTVGRALAARLGRPFVDLDARITARAGLSVAEIFASQGEARFRELERQATKEIAAAAAPMVVAPGGGWVVVPGLVALLRPPSRLVWLRLSPQSALARMGASVLDRPLLAGDDPLAALTGILATREAAYLQSDHTVSVETMTVDEVVDAIVTLARP